MPLGVQFATPVWAQSQQAAQAIEEVVVTARKREESLQQVPLAISAFSALELETQGVQTLKDLTFLTPGITMIGAAEANIQPIIRGIVNLGGAEPNVATFLDGVYLANQSTINLSFMGVERIEVVKGPVSALYGRNAFAGAINYVSKKPTDEFEGRIQLTAGNDGQKTATGYLSGPLVPGKLRARLSAIYDDFNGSYKDQVNGLKAGAFEKKDVVLNLNFTPTDDLEISGTVYYGDDVFGINAATYLDNNCGGLIGFGPQATELRRYCGLVDTDARPVEVPPITSDSQVAGNNREVFSANLNITYDFGWGTVSSLTGFNDNKQLTFNDFTARRNGMPYFLNPGPGTVNLFQAFGGASDNDDFSEEIRISSAQDQRFRWTVGGFYFSADRLTSTFIGLDSNNIPAGRTISCAANICLFFLEPGGAPDPVRRSITNNQDKQISGFAGTDFDITDALTVNGELRYTDQTKDADIVSLTTTPVPAFRPLGGPFEAKYDFWDYRASAKYQVNDDVMVYVSYAKGTKGGDFNQRATIPSEIQYGPEKNKTAEVGAKTRWLDGRLQANVAVFRIEDIGLQVQGPSDNPAAVGLVTKNFGSTTSKGFEVELAALPTEGARFNLGVGYADPTYDDTAFDFGALTICQQIGPPICAADRIVQITTPQGPRTAFRLGGLQTPRTSKWQVSLAANFDGPLTGDWTWFAGADYRYESRWFFDQTNTSWVSSRNHVSARAGVETGAIKLTAFVDNLTNDDTPDAVGYNVRLNDLIGNFVVALPFQRRYGLTVSYAF
ncbi:MAG: TonB-dependent receptor [Rhodospirillaceae bacterium]|nr:TonB-dependent receptor [Rhodospirillaceae bacterium]